MKSMNDANKMTKHKNYQYLIIRIVIWMIFRRNTYFLSKMIFKLN